MKFTTTLFRLSCDDFIWTRFLSRLKQIHHQYHQLRSRGIILMNDDCDSVGIYAIVSAFMLYSCSNTDGIYISIHERERCLCVCRYSAS